MEYSFINKDLDKKNFLTSLAGDINPLLAENNVNQFLKMKEFFLSDSYILLVNGFLGTGKSTVVEHFLKFLNQETIVLNYNCYETTILDDMLLSFFENFKELIENGVIQEPKMRSDNFTQKINSYFLTISAPFVLVIDSFDSILRANKAGILEFLKHLAQTGKVKVVLIARTFDLKDFDDNFTYERVSIGTLAKDFFEKYLKASGIKLIGPLSDELYKQTRGYFLYTALSVKIIQIRGLSLYEFLDGFGKSFLNFNDFILREGLAIVDPVSGHLFRFLTLVRHPVSVKLLKTLRLFDEVKIRFFLETMVLSRDGNLIYLKDYYKEISENSIPANVSVKLHRSCVDLYNTQLPLKPMERDLLISRATMRSEIEYHSMFLPKKPVVKPKETSEPVVIADIKPAKPEVEEQPQSDIQSIRFIFDSEEEEHTFMSQVADSINEFVTFTDEQLKEIERENNLSLVKLMNLARQEENSFNFKRVVMIYQRALMMKNEHEFQVFLPIINSRLAKAYEKLSDWFNALRYYEETLKIYETAGDMFKFADTKYDIANIYYLMFKREQARAVIDEILAMNSLPPETYIKTNILAADLSDGDVETAYNSLKAAVECVDDFDGLPLLAELYYKFALASDEIGETKQAVLFYKKCVDLEMENNLFASGSYSNLAVIYEEADAKDSAIKFYELSLELDEKNGNSDGIYHSAMKLAVLYRRINSETALKFSNLAYATACRMNEPLYKVSSTMALGDFYFLNKEPEKALEKYTAAKTFAQGNLSENNIKKIDRRVNDLKIQLGIPIESGSGNEPQ